MSHAVLLVDADESTTTFLADQLAADGYEPAVATTLSDAYNPAVVPEVIVLGDLAERRHALGLLDDIRAGARPFDPDVAVLVLTDQGDPLDMLRAFDHGADDVAVKPVSYPELRARIRALQRRRRPRAGELIRIRDLEIDVPARAVRLTGEPIAVTQREFALLLHMAAEPQRVFTKAELLDRVWGLPAGCSTRTLDSHVSRVRRKLRERGDQSWVVNVWGVGYALTDVRSHGEGRAA
jgi:DNA-binding response OmpR family regulator